MTNKKRNKNNHRSNLRRNTKKRMQNQNTANFLDRIVKINLPKDKTSWESGNGETVWVRLTKGAYAAYGKDIHYQTSAILLNDSFYYPDLRHGDQIKIELRPHKKPVALYSGQLETLTVNPMVTSEEFLEQGIELEQFFPQVRAFDAFEHLAFVETGETYAFYSAFYPPTNSPSELSELRDESIRNMRSNGCSH